MVFYSLPPEIGSLLGLTQTGRKNAPNQFFKGYARSPSDGLFGQPDFVAQSSWCTMLAQATNTAARVCAFWRERSGRDTDLPAITLTPAGAFFGHFWSDGRRLEVRELMGAVVREIVPAFREKESRRIYASIGRIAGTPSVEEIQGKLSSTLSPAIQKEWKEVSEKRGEAKMKLDAGDWNAAIDIGGQAANTAVRGWMLAQESKTNEVRGFCCHSPWGLREDKSWDDSIKFLRENGFNTIIPNMCLGRTAFYPSDVLSVSPLVKTRGDALSACLAACKKYGVKCHAWRICWNMGDSAEGLACANGRGKTHTEIF